MKFYSDAQSVPLGFPTPADHCQTQIKIELFGEEALPRKLTSECRIQEFRTPQSPRTHLCPGPGGKGCSGDPW